ncbi:MAG: NAD-dependent epimerase/dehydratase family protein [Gemmatimonadota bacterium]|nr:NAD-dependent epimerase/dehydratase family protein [Gemmatimonadota bacterium]
MKILVTGGTGVVGTGTVTELLRRGHEVVLVARHAREDVRQWPAGVVAKQGDVGDAPSIHGFAEGCDAVLHVTGIVEETPPDATFERVNVGGTRNIIAEAQRAGVDRFVYVSSLGADKGDSEYHRSKRKGEELTRGFTGNWTICRPGNVYGPGDEQISVLLRLVRGPSPIVPKVGAGDQPFQPLWWEDAAAALAEVVERSDLAGADLDLAGTEITSQNDLLERFHRITGKSVQSIALPEIVATLGARIVSAVGWDINFTDDQLQMLREGNVIAADRPNALVSVLGMTPTPLDTGLRALCNLQPEQLPESGIGSLKRKRFWADISGCEHTPESLFELFRTNFNEATPVFVDAAVEPGTTQSLEDGETLTLALPMRGHVQVRVGRLEPRRVTLLTLAGHPLAGAVRFFTEQHGTSIRFQAEVYDRAANVIDLVAMRTVGDHLQDHTWSQVVEKVVELSGGATSGGVEHESESLSDEQAAAVDKWLRELTIQRKRAENEERIAEPA